MNQVQKETYDRLLTGEVFFELRDAATGDLLDSRHYKNLIVRDAGVLIARLLANPDEPRNGVNMLGVGTGAPGAALNPDAPTNSQRSLRAEIARKNVTYKFRTSLGAESAVPTNIVDFTCTYNEGEAVGALNEMALLSTWSATQSTAAAVQVPNVTPYDATVDLRNYDTMLNILNFPVISKPGTATLTLTWRLTI